MHNLFTGLMGFFMGIGMFFHGGHIHLPNTPQTSASVTATPSGTLRKRFGMGRNLPRGERPFFGTITSVNGSSITVQMQMRMRPFGNITPSVTPSTPQTLTINLDSSTTYTGGSQSDIATNIRVAGILKTNSDGSFTAVTVQINPPMPSGFPGRGGTFGNIPSGSKLIFGQVSTVNGNQLTIQRQNRFGNSANITVDLSNTTQYTGGSQTDIQTGTRIAGYGTTNTDGSINAQQLTINPSFSGKGENNGQ